MNKLLKLIFLIGYLLIPKIVHSKETRKIVAIVDTGMPREGLIHNYLCNTNHYDVTGTGIQDRYGHGTNIAGTIARHLNIKTHCIMIIKWWDTEETSKGYTVLATAVRAFLAILDDVRPAYINLSLSGNNYMSYEFNVIKGLIKTGSVVVAAAGNEGHNLDFKCDSFPGCYNLKDPNFHMVGALNIRTGTREFFSNYGKVVTDYEDGNSCAFGVCMVGTSQSTATLTGKLISAKVH